MANLQPPTKDNTLNIVDSFKMELNAWKHEIDSVLPKDMSSDIFMNTVINAVQMNQTLLSVDRNTLKTSVLKCASRGLLPDGEEAMFTIRSENLNKSKKDAKGDWLKPDWHPTAVEFTIKRKGVQKILYRYSNVSKVVSHCVYKNDHFKFLAGDEERIEHEICTGERGEFLGVYGIFKFKDGGEPIRDYMHQKEIETVKSVSTYKETWNLWHDELSRTAILKRMAKKIYVSMDVYDDQDYKMITNEEKPNETPALARPAASLDNPLTTPAQGNINDDDDYEDIF